MSEILPLAITMMIGPQIITSIILVTSKNPIWSSLAYVAGVALAATVGVGFFFVVSNLFNLTKSDSNQPSSFAIAIQTILIGLLILASLKTFVNREKVKLPSWMQGLQNASPGRSFKIALSLIFFMPTDLAVMSTVGINKASHNSQAVDFLPFLGLTVLIAALPLLGYLLFRKRAEVFMPKVRTWMENNSWVVSIAAYVIFLYLLWP